MSGDLPDLDTERPVDPALVEAFGRDGHVLVRGLADREEVEAYRPAIEQAAMRHNRETRPLEERGTYGQAFLQITNLWQHDDAVARFVRSRRFARAAAELLEVDGVRLYHDQALFKEPGGGRTPWHQDQFYWPFDTDRTVTMWMPLVDVPPEVGTMTFASGSQRCGYLGEYEISDTSDAVFEAVVAERGLELHTHGPVAAGDATFHRGWTLHSAPPNPTTAMRPVMTVIYFADGARVAPPQSPYQEFDRSVWLGGIEPGRPAAGPLNPLLWRRS